MKLEQDEWVDLGSSRSVGDFRVEVIRVYILL